MADIGRAKVPVEFDKQQVARDADAAISPAVESAAKNAAKLAAGVFASKALFDFGKAGFDELAQQQTVAAQSTVLLRREASITQGDIDALGQSMLDLAGFDDEAATSAANVLLRFGAIHDAQTLKRVEGDAADLAVAMGTDLPSAAQILGRAIQDPETGLRQLRPVIGTLTDAQKASIKAFQDQGDAAGAMNVVLEAVESRIGGTAKQFGDTLPANVKRAQEEITNAKASLVEGLAPALDLGASLATRFAQGVEDLPGPLRTVASVVVGTGVAVAGVAQPIAGLIGTFNQLKTARALNDLASVESTTATTVEAGANDALAVSAGAAAVAQGEQAVAAEGVAVAEGEAAIATEGATVASGAALGPLAAVAIAVGVAALAYEGLSNASKFSIDTTKGLRASTADLVRTFQFANATGNQKSFIDSFTSAGAAGVGQLKLLRDEIHRTGGDTSVLDAAISGAKTGQENYNTALSAGKDAMGEFDTAAADTSALEQRKEAVRAITDQLHEVEQAALRLAPADVRARRGALSLQDANDRAAKAAQDLADAQASGDPTKIAKAQRDLDRANLDVEQSTLDLADAQVELQVTQDKLAGKNDTELDQLSLLEGALGTLSTSLTGPTHDAIEAHRQDLQRALIDARALADAELEAKAAAGDVAAGTQLRKDRGEQQGGTGGFAAGGLAPAFQPFRHGEHGWELALLGDGVSRLDRDAFVIDHRTSANLLTPQAAAGGGLTVGTLNVGSRADLPDVRVELKRLSLASRF